jgi:hypothetical protein
VLEYVEKTLIFFVFTGKIETCVGLGSIVGSVIAVLVVGILIGVICTFFILTRKGNLKGMVIYRQLLIS